MQVLGVGLNKTGTKTLAHYFRQWGFRHISYDLDSFGLYRAGRLDELFERMEGYDSCEDWPWPLLFREVDARFPDARFVLTTRRSSDAWYRSLCNMAVRMGPMRRFEKHIYGYSMPHGHREEHLAFYEAHNQAVREHFRDRPEKLLEICWETSNDPRPLADFLGKPCPEIPVHENRSPRVYSGDNPWLAHAYRIPYQVWWYSQWYVRKALGLRR